jgi:hypothetical protein
MIIGEESKSPLCRCLGWPFDAHILLLLLDEATRARAMSSSTMVDAVTSGGYSFLSLDYWFGIQPTSWFLRV